MRINKIIDLGRQVMGYLKPHHRIDFLKYESQVGLLQEEQVKKAYIIGLCDGYQLVNQTATCPTKCPTELLKP